MSLLTTLYRAIASSSGWTPPSGTDYPTTFSPTVRGGVGTGFGAWADGGLLVARHESSSSWKAVRAHSGIADGEKVSCWMTVTGTSNLVGFGLGTASADVESYTGDSANGYTLFGHVADIYYNGGSVSGTTGTLAQNDRVRMDVDRVADTVQFYKQTGGTGSYVSMAAAIDISGLGTGVLYPFANVYNASGILTFDFGQGSETPGSGFTAGPVGEFLPWSYSMLDAWLHSDTKRMWQQSSDTGVLSPNVTTAGNPIGAWYGITYGYLRSNATASARLEYQTAGVLYDSSGATKYFPASYSRNYNAPYYAVLRVIDMASRSPAFGAAEAASLSSMRVGFAPRDTTTSPRVNSVTVTTTDTAIAADKTVAISYDGTNYIVVDGDGNVYTGAGGSGTMNTDTLMFRALTATPSVGKIVYMQEGATALTQEELQNLWWAAGQIA